MSSILLTRSEVAKKLRVCERTIDNLRKNKGLPYSNVGRSIRFIEDAINSWLQGQHWNQNLPNTETDDKKTCGQ
jgi:excisionase family DNA binding protein